MVLAVAVAAGGLAASCVKYGLTDTSDYIGTYKPGTLPAPAISQVEPAPPSGATPPAVAAPVARTNGEPAPGAQPVPEPPLPGLPPRDQALAKLPTPGPPETRGEPVSLTVTQAYLTALQNNQALVVQRLNPPITRTFEETQLAAFDPDLTGTWAQGRSSTLGGAGQPWISSDTVLGNMGFSQFFPTGTTVGAGLSTLSPSPAGSIAGEDFFASRAGLSVTQSLLRGYGMDVNLASLREARIDTLSTQYQLRGFAEALVAQVEETYWDYTLAQRQIEIFNQSLKLAEDQLRETEERIRVGKLAQIEIAAAQSEVATRREGLIDAYSLLAKTRLALLRLTNPTQADYWTRDVKTDSLPIIPDVKLDRPEVHVQLAMKMRSDLNQARLQVQRGDLVIVQTKNGLLPKLDLFVTLGKTGYADSFGRSWEKLDDKGYDFMVGANFEYAPLNRSAKAADQRARLTRHQSAEAVANLAQLVEVDVRSALIEVTRSREQTVATVITRRLQEEKVRAEMEKFRVGKSTTLLVAQTQRDLLLSQINEVMAVVANLKALVELFRFEGSLLERRGIAAPGREPVQMPPERLP
jgi:outer membrane protein TolC